MLFQFPVFLVKLGQSFVAEALRVKPLLVNRADEGNVATIRWLEMLGATFTNRFPNYRGSGRQFVDFEIRKDAA